MPHSFFGSRRSQVFAHRGGSALAPENTIAAFDHGLALGADGLELDVRLSRDGIAVVHHDATLERTTNRHDAIATCTAAELRATDAGWHFRRGDRHPFRGRGVAVPTLAEVLARYAGVPLIVELKSTSRSLVHAVVNDIREAKATERVCVGSFDLRALRMIRALEPRIATSASRREVVIALMRTWCRWPWRSPVYAGFQVPERSGPIEVVTPRFISRAHRAGLGVQVWTVDEPEAARRLLGYGVDGLITDRPDLIVPIVRALRETTAAP